VACPASAHIIFAKTPSHHCTNFLLDPQFAKGYEASQKKLPRSSAQTRGAAAARVGPLLAILCCMQVSRFFLDYACCPQPAGYCSSNPAV
jgi:hypothetical protein